MSAVFFFLSSREVISMFDDEHNFPNAIEMEKQLLSAMFMKQGQVVPDVAAILDADDLYRPEHQMIFRAVLRLYSKGAPIDFLAVEEELRKADDLQKIDHRYLLSLIDATYTTALAESHAKTIKEKAERRRLIQAAQILYDDAKNSLLPLTDTLAKAQSAINRINRSVAPAQKSSFVGFFAKHFNDDIALMKNYAQRLTGFSNLDQQQFFSPGLYVLGATPASGKTTFCWQLLEQLARRGETCIYCSYEMSRLELFTKSLARELYVRAPFLNLTAASIRRGSWSNQMNQIVADFANQNLDLSVLELQDESIDELLALLRPFCSDKAKAPVVCLDYLQIVPTSRESAKLGIDDSVRKLKKFQRDTNTTFLVISSFNRTNYTQSVSFESFKESGNIEYTADVVWALQLFALNSLNPFNVADARKKIDDAKKRQPRQVQLKCLKNRQGTNYECFFNYFAARDCFEPCEKFSETNQPSKSKRKHGDEDNQ